MVEKPRFRRRTVFAKNLGFGVGFGYRNNTSADVPGHFGTFSAKVSTHIGTSADMS